MRRNGSHKEYHAKLNAVKMAEQYPKVIDVFDNLTIDLEIIAGNLLEDISKRGYKIGEIKDILTIQKNLAHHKSDFIKHKIITLAFEVLDDEIDNMNLENIKKTETCSNK